MPAELFFLMAHGINSLDTSSVEARVEGVMRRVSGVAGRENGAIINYLAVRARGVGPMLPNRLERR